MKENVLKIKSFEMLLNSLTIAQAGFTQDKRVSYPK
jgi:hypothetical protein